MQRSYQLGRSSRHAVQKVVRRHRRVRSKRTRAARNVFLGVERLEVRSLLSIEHPLLDEGTQTVSGIAPPDCGLVEDVSVCGPVGPGSEEPDDELDDPAADSSLLDLE